MKITAPALRTVQPGVVFAMLVFTTCILWVGAFNSGIAKQPVFVLGSALIVALSLSASVLEQQVNITLTLPEFVVALHLPLFVISAVLSYNVVYTRDALLFAVCGVTAFFAGSKLFQAGRDKRWLFEKTVILTTVLCAIGLIQYLFGEHLPLNFFIGPDRRVTSLLGNSNFFSAYMVLTMPLVLAAALRDQTKTTKRWRYYLLLGSMAVVLLATQARSSAIACGIALITFSALSRQKQTRTVAVAVICFIAAVMIVAAILNPQFRMRFATMFDSGGSFGRRTYVWTGAVDAFLASPAIGHGIGKFEPVLFAYRSPDYWKAKSEDVVAHAHNELLEIAVEYGTIGIVLTGALMFLVMHHGVRIAREAKRAESMTAIALVSSIAGIAVDNLANVSLRQAPIALLTWLLMGVLCSMNQENLSPRRYLIPLTLPLITAALPLVAWLGFFVWYGADQLHVLNSNVHVMSGLTLPEERISQRIQHFDAATGTDPSNLLSRSLLAREYMKAQRWNEELQQLEQLQALSPLYPKSFLMKAYALTQFNRNMESLQAIEEELRLRSHPESFRIQSIVYEKQGDTTNARQTLFRMLEKCNEGKTVEHVLFACKRLVALNRTEAERQEAQAAFNAVYGAFSDNFALIEHLNNIDMRAK